MNWSNINFESTTYFDDKAGKCAQSYDSIIEEKLSFDLFHKNPNFITVSNEYYPEKIYVSNDHEGGEQYEKRIEGVNMHSSDNYKEIGVWRIKYKLQ